MKQLGKLLKQRHKRLRPIFTEEDTSCYRIYDRDLEGYPYTIDLYDRHLLITEYEQGREDPQARLKKRDLIDTAASMLYLDPDHVIYKYRPKRRGIEQHEKLEERGELVPVHENGLMFYVNLHDYIDTGLFMNQRITRAMVAREALGLRVLNLFSYTGSFSVYAAAGGALETRSVDLSSKYLGWAKKNMEANGFIGGQHHFIASDVREYLMEALEQSHRYDLIILDPPLFSNSRKMQGTFDLQRDYVWFLASSVKLLAPGGRLLFCVPNKTFHFDPGRIKGIESQEITQETIPEDFSGRKPHRCWIVQRKQVTVSRKSV